MLSELYYFSNFSSSVFYTLFPKIHKYKHTTPQTITGHSKFSWSSFNSFFKNQNIGENRRIIVWEWPFRAS